LRSVARGSIPFIPGTVRGRACRLPDRRRSADRRSEPSLLESTDGPEAQSSGSGAMRIES
jgi:hypothetical protein